MGIIIIIVIVILVIYFVRKSSSESGSSASGTAAAPAELYFTDLPDEERTARRTRYCEIMQGPNGSALAKCREKVWNLFIPNKNLDFKGSLSGILYESDRAKKLEKIDSDVLAALRADPETYEIWWSEVYDDILNSAYQDRRLSALVSCVLTDLQHGDALLDSVGLKEQMVDPANLNTKIKVSTPDGTIKVDISEKRGRIFHEVKGAYRIFRTGVSLDPLVRNAEVLMAISGLVKETQKSIDHRDIEKYDIPSLTKTA